MHYHYHLQQRLARLLDSLRRLALAVRHLGHALMVRSRSCRSKQKVREPVPRRSRSAVSKRACVRACVRCSGAVRTG